MNFHQAFKGDFTSKEIFLLHLFQDNNVENINIFLSWLHFALGYVKFKQYLFMFGRGEFTDLQCCQRDLKELKLLKSLLWTAFLFTDFRNILCKTVFFCGFMWGCRISLRSKFVPY